MILRRERGKPGGILEKEQRSLSRLSLFIAFSNRSLETAHEPHYYPLHLFFPFDHLATIRRICLFRVFVLLFFSSP